MLHLMHHYATPTLAGMVDVPMVAPWLAEKMRAHVQRAAPDQAGDLDPAAVAEQFGALVLIQPAMFGDMAFDFQPSFDQDPDFADYDPEGNLDSYDIRRTQAEGLALIARAVRAMRDPSTYPQLLGVPAKDIAGLAPPERGDAARYHTRESIPAAVAAEEAMRAELGQLGDGDVYWLPSADACGLSLGGENATKGVWDAMTRTTTLMTNARYDAIVYTEGIPASFLHRYPSGSASIDSMQPAGVARPGLLLLKDDASGIDLTIRFPTYEAGHEVSIGAPEELAEDIERWLGINRLLPE